MPQPTVPPAPPPKPKTPPPVPEYCIATTSLINGVSTTLYSLRPPPAWPPPSSEVPAGRNFKVLYDPLVDKDRDGKWRALIERVRSTQPAEDADPEDASSSKEQEHEKKSNRIKGKGKGREMLMRFNGETVPGEPAITPQDPRKMLGFKRNKLRGEFHLLKYEVSVFHH